MSSLGDFIIQPDVVTGLKWGGTEDGGGVLTLTTEQPDYRGDTYRVIIPNHLANVLLKALLADATVRIEPNRESL